MKTLNQQIKTFTMAACLTLIANMPALAEDIEVYTGGSTLPSNVRPNLTFIIDTSGSMNNDVDTEVSAADLDTFDPARIYPGNCVAGRIYWSTSGSAPGCETTSWWGGTSPNNNYFNASANKCGASFNALGTGAGASGFFVTTGAARYRDRGSNEDRWSTLSSSDHDAPVECRNDWGVHGETDATDPYPADENDSGPWRSNTSNAVNVANAGAVYTLYSANYLNWKELADAGGTITVTQTRLEIVQSVFSNLMDSISGGVNLSVMRFNNSQGGRFIMPMQELTDVNRGNYKTAVNDLNPGGWTPLAETLYESYRFYRGDSEKYGSGSNVSGVATGGTYDSPIEYQCQKNFVILLTDGAPTEDTDANSNIAGLTGAACNGNCLDELAGHMNSADCRNDLNDVQNVITYTIGFDFDPTVPAELAALNLLQSTANNGGGKFYTANNSASLTDVFTSIFTDVLGINTTFIAPAVSVNAFNRFNHREELYYALFKPDQRPDWRGNIKRFRLYSPDPETPPSIVDANTQPAIDPNTAFFKSTARSFWTPNPDAPDGDNVELGGAASMLDIATRNVYTYTGVTAPSNEDLSSTANKLVETNDAITKVMLGDAAMTDTRRTELLMWAQGVDVTDEDSDTETDDTRRLMGDPLHTKPVLVTYGGTDDAPDMTLYAGTNEGYLHAIDTTTGAEEFTFVPQELLPNLSILLDNDASVDHPYGLDGPLTAWVNDINDNGVVFSGASLDPGEFVYLYQGMRRGGNNYYALDATQRNAPKLKWMIKGGTGGTPGFAELGQTWSTTTLAKIKFNGTDRVVIIFGGGYDDAQDNNDIAQNDTLGRAIYMVDATTGQKIWEAGPSNSAGSPNLVVDDMTNSIPSDVTVIDTDFDGYKDRMYVGDMRGQLWRFDIDNKNNTGAANLVTGGVIARLGDNTPEGNRRFYYAPDVSLGAGRRFINIAIGSGYRAHPLNTNIHDAFFVIRDEFVFEPERDMSDNPVYNLIASQMSALFDATDNVLGEGSAAAIETASGNLANAGGYYISLNKFDGSFVGEKVLAKSLTFGGFTMFTTYTPTEGTSPGGCSPSQGEARAYLIHVADGTPVPDEEFSGTGGSSSGGGGGGGTTSLTRIDREKDLVRGGIPPEPTIIFHENAPVLLVGTEDMGNPGGLQTPVKTNWRVVRD